MNIPFHPRAKYLLIVRKKIRSAFRTRFDIPTFASGGVDGMHEDESTSHG